MFLSMRSMFERRKDAIQQQTVVEILYQRMRLLSKDRLSVPDVAPISIPQPSDQDSALTLREAPEEVRELLLTASCSPI